MKCLNCNATDFKNKKIRFNPVIKNEEVTVVLPAYICVKCDETLMDNEQMNALRKGAADSYRIKHRLLTSEQIVELRKKLEMTQKEFANYLKVGEASIKRWETYFVQDEGQDEHIRLKADKDCAELNALEMHWKNLKEDVYSGFKKFDFDMFKNVVLALLPSCKSPLYLNKALFYVDFLHYKNHGKSLTGSRYVALDYGPCPDKFQELFSLLIKKNILTKTSEYNLKSNEKLDISIFDDLEWETIRTIDEFVKKNGSRKIYDFSHEEKAYQKADYLGTLIYNSVDKLKIS